MGLNIKARCLYIKETKNVGQFKQKGECICMCYF